MGEEAAGSADRLLGRLVAGKFRVQQLLASGGMGRIYLAEQVNLGKAVALKVLRTNIAADADLARRFRREAKSASLLSHPNILQVLDFGDDDGLLFIAMELLVGRDLFHVIAQDRPLPPRRIGHIGAQILAALEEAHANGVVHRDLKPENVVLLDARGEPDFVKVCDFGLAKLAADRGPSAITLSGAVCGTPEYMSPEQARGETIDGRSDLYAMACILYQMVTGEPPFRADSAMGVLTRQVQDRPEPPSRRMPDGVTPALEQVILRGLEKSRTRRFATAAEMRAALLEAVGTPSLELELARPKRALPRGDSEGMALPTTPYRPLLGRGWRQRWRGRVLVASVLSVLAFAGGSGARLYLRERQRQPAPASSRQRRTVAVLGFRDLSARAQTAWLSTALAEMLGTELGQSQRLRALSGEEVARMKSELALKDAEGLDGQALARVRRDLDADLVLLGSYTVLEAPAAKPLRLDVRVQETTSGDTVAAVADVGDENELFDLVARIGKKLRAQLLPEALDFDARASRASLPANIEAARAYADGLSRLRLHDAAAARPLLQQAIEADPGHAPTRVALAQAWAALGYDSRAEEEAEKALGLVGPLGREQKLSVTAYHHMTTHEWQKAINDYQTLFDFFPDNLDYGLQLAEAEWRGPSPRRALETLSRMQKLPPPEGNDPRLELARTQALLALGDHQGVVTSAESTKRKARARGADLIAAAAAQLEAMAWMRLGQCDRATAAVDEAKVVLTRTGDRQAIARSTVAVSLCLQENGDNEMALRLNQDMMATCEEIGDRWGMAVALHYSGNALAELGRRSEALTRWERAAALFRELNDRRRLNITLGNIALAHFHLGDLVGARRRTQEVIAQVEHAEDKSFLGYVTLQQVRIETALGELATAQDTLEGATLLARQSGEAPKVVDARMLAAQLLAIAGQLDEAERQLNEAAALLRTMGPDLQPRDIAVGRAELALARGQSGAAESLVRGVVSEYEHGHGAVDGRVQAMETLARALAAEHKPEEARPLLERAAELMPVEAQLETRLRLELARVVVEAEEGHAAAARRRNERALAEARRAHFAPLELRARLLAVQLTTPATALAVQARALREEAARRGFVLISRQAEALEK
jgi:tetratricopeptide (TPR) repeat protein/tRNA A-37 threonylcarbamoyl transferase component Bud32